ncbi:MAG: hypothetical protein WCL27_13840 [Betaproteobacteria bacterium]
MAAIDNKKKNLLSPGVVWVADRNDLETTKVLAFSLVTDRASRVQTKIDIAWPAI